MWGVDQACSDTALSSRRATLPTQATMDDDYDEDFEDYDGDDAPEPKLRA